MSTVLLERHRVETEREAAILDTTVELLLGSGFDGLTVEGVARRARVGKATIYSRWGGKPLLVVAALTRLSELEHVESDDHGSLRADLLAVAEQLQRERQRSVKLVLALAQAVQTDERIAEAVQRLISEPAKARSRALAERAVARGEMPAASIDLPHVFDILPSLLVTNLLLAPHEPVDATVFIDAVLLPLLTGPDPTARRKR